MAKQLELATEWTRDRIKQNDRLNGREGMAQEHIHTAITNHADTELRYERAYEDNNRVRVAGPFVDRMSPHGSMSFDIDRCSERVFRGTLAVEFAVRADDPGQPGQGRRAERPHR